MIKRFQDFNRSFAINESNGDLYRENFLISPDSSYWQKAFDYFKKETGKDLNQFKWVFNENMPTSGIWPQNFVVALMSSSPVLSKYKGLIGYIKDFISEGNLSYYRGDTKDNYVNPSQGSLVNSAALFNIWTKYFYEPLKKAAETRNLDSITQKGMSDFEERMGIFLMDYDSDWSQFFSAIKLALQPVESGAAQQNQVQSQQQAAAKQKPVAKKERTSGEEFKLPTSFK